jgi:hypothetical protein
MLKFIKDLLTENDSTTYCIARVAFAIALLGFMGNATYQLYSTHVLDLANFATGISTILASGGASIALKSVKSA